MTTTIPQFRERATIAIADIRLQSALEGATGRFATAREVALAALPWADELRDHFKAMRAATLANLAEHLQTFERNALAAGAHVHWAKDGAEACTIVTDIARRRGVTLATKSKSMATEEIHLNKALTAAGIQPVETDLGEWIIQLAEEPPSHIIAPAIHKTKEQVAELFARESGRPQSAADIPALTAEARRMLREKFLAAGMGISGGNLAVAEAGSILLVTNEGNGRMITSAPPVHVAIIGIEKIAPTWDDAAVWLSLLARSATGQPMSIYTTVVTGPKRMGDPDGPEEVHVVLLDNGRSHLIGTKYEEVLQCIRCGACLNVCPVYRAAGGHAYGSPYSGPIGAVISPLLFGLDKYPALPHASSLCGACKDVCPARIDLPRMLLELRADLVTQGMAHGSEALLEGGVSLAMRNEQVWALVMGLGRWGQRPLLKNGHLAIPDRFNPAGERQLPSLAKKSFRDLWRDGEV
ncbi:MAG: iron-sulfur cluster-binding protein [Anaerolinea sp.]|nr:iron-sulfur cluster-binding protein [Anaerolinea sp.]